MVELEDLPSVGEKTAEKLRDAGFADMMRLATATPKELSVKAEIGEGVAEKVIEAARKAEDIGFETALEVDERRKDVGHISVGSKGFNDLIAGGIETQAITTWAMCSLPSSPGCLSAAGRVKWCCGWRIWTPSEPALILRIS